MKVSIIIVNYNGKHLLDECFDSVLGQSFTDFDIIFVDNGSTDGSTDYIASNYTDGRIKIVTSEKNLGFAGGNNLGYKNASGEYIVLLNNDTRVSEDWLKVLVETIESDDVIGIVQSLVITEGVPADHYKKNGTINLLGHNVMGFFEINQDGIGEIFQANGCSMIIKWKLVEQLGGLFPDEYFAYAEDTYLSFKVLFNGKKIMHNSRSIVYHKGNATSKKQVSSLMYYYRERNRLLNFILFFTGSFQIKYLLFLFWNFQMKLILSLFSKNYSFSGLFKAYWWLVSNPKWIREHRRLLEGYQNLNEIEVLKYISGKVFNGDNLFARFSNSLSLFYCKLVGLKVFEVNKRD